MPWFELYIYSTAENNLGGSMQNMENLVINENDLDYELAHQAAKYLHAAKQYFEAETAYRTAKSNLEYVESVVRREVRDNADKKMTVDQVADAARLDQRVVEAQRAYNEATANRDYYKSLKEAWYQRKDLVVQLAILQRNELNSLSSEHVVQEQQAQ